MRQGPRLRPGFFRLPVKFSAWPKQSASARSITALGPVRHHRLRYARPRAAKAVARRSGGFMEQAGAFGRVRGLRMRAGKWLVCAVLMLVAMDAFGMRRIKEGEAPKLAPDEGLVVISVDTSTPIATVHVGRVGGGTATVLNYLKIGRNPALFAAKAGEYEWAQMKLTNGFMYSRFRIGKPEFRFTVTAGKIVYPGDLVLRPSSLTNAYIQVHNRTLPIMDWLQAEHAALYAQLPFEYTGYYPDPFPAHYRAAVAKNSRPGVDLNAGREAPKPQDLPIPADMMWKPSRIAAVALNPAGDLLAETVREEKGYWTLNLIDLRAGRSQRLSAERYPPDTLRWKGDRTLIAASGGWHGSHTVYVVGDANQDGKYRIKELALLGTGRVVDLLPSSPDEILFEGYDSAGKLVVHRVRLEGDKSIRGFTTARSRDRVNQGATNDRAWYADGNGRLRAAIVARDEATVLVHAANGSFHDVLNSDEDFSFDPVGLSFDGNTIYGLTDEDRAQRDLVALDPVTRKITRTGFSKPGVDIVSASFNERREPVAARYYEAGRLVTEYFDDANRKMLAWVRTAFPGKVVTVLDRSTDNAQLILWVDGSDHPPQVYHLDVASKKASLIDEMAPWLSDKVFAPAYVINAKGKDGLPIEAFLTLPAGTSKRPLVLFPHGGPVGVSDSLNFDRDVQFLASQGYAVLQVNFRGSEGYGKAFREAGYNNHGRMIEDDIDAALRIALATYPLDESRMCTLGASYGGYSALISAIRWPGRFKCAVSMSGVSDRALFFTASDNVRSEKMRPELERLLGNPRTDLAAMQAVSPLYHTDQLTLPVMLVHGREDVRVDFEHTRRLVRMLNLENRQPVLMAIPDMEHDLGTAEVASVVWTGIAGFLQLHLGAAPGPAAGAPAAASQMPDTAK
ncbi:alpha/beta hydrolase family protein [Lysobacter solisilvae (ex Woo and Kim 2022)]|uniref:S9 family peptidase n=1 Tax=Agrilutibacter terrestris TaxID=2865112 RepID=A0A7H0FWV8_9GAMM|nr:prolyl oligopeptidase family serine peptidase [Lysobacter terrestris]QNP40524.1 S9 family peptidase [Lysobacter terrestris]